MSPPGDHWKQDAVDRPNEPHSGEYTPAFQDEYRRLWHEASARVQELEAAVGRVVSFFDETNDAGWRDREIQLGARLLDGEDYLRAVLVSQEPT